MRHVTHYAAALVAFALCSACGGPAGGPSTALGDYHYVGKALSANGRLVTAARAGGMPPSIPMGADHHWKWKTFEYIINDYGTYASIFDYPKSTKQIGSISNVGGQGCTNLLYGYGHTAFWIVAGSDQITEYDARKKPIKTLSDSVGPPSSCAMDAAGDLAVGILYGSGGGDVVIFKGASGSGTVYKTPLGKEYFDGYDPQGDLFADGFTGDYDFELVELPYGGSKFETIKTSNKVKFPGSVQWDGTHLTVVDQLANAIYQYNVSGTTATLQGTVQLTGSSDCAQTWIVEGLVYCADAGTDDGEVFNYPAGGSPVAVFSGDFDLPLGTVAVRKR